MPIKNLVSCIWFRLCEGAVNLLSLLPGWSELTVTDAQFRHGAILAVVTYFTAHDLNPF